MSGPRKLRTILERWQPANTGADPDATSAVAIAWADVVGPDVARRTRPGKLHDGALIVYTAGSTWSHQLTFLAPKIVAALNERCPQSVVSRLRFVVASGRTKALLDGIARTATVLERVRNVGQTAVPATLDAGPDDAEDIIARLRRRQQALDRRRERAGWTRCAQCSAWREPSDGAARPCRACAEEARRAGDNRIERVLINAPWLRRTDIASHVPDAQEDAYDRVRRRLLSRWEEQMFTAQRRLRRRELLASDRVVAWSYLMLRSGMQQHVIGRAVVSDALGDAWADALAGASNARHREATATAVQKHRKTTTRVFTRRDNT
jgi:predicted nucleic acid-binding Zn ribbon protein